MFDPKKRQKSLYAKDPVFREKMLLRNKLRYMLLLCNTRPSYVMQQYLGVTREQARRHIASQFTGDMSWETYGKAWEIDHIVELRTAVTVEDVRALFYYMNLQPMPRGDNRNGRYPVLDLCNIENKV